jgi:hypothetical protein
VSVSLTDHAFRRWHQRSEEPSTDPLVAWLQGVEVEVEYTALEGDEVRYHEATDTCLVRKDDAVVTVIEVSEAPWRTQQAVAALDGGEQR